MSDESKSQSESQSQSQSSTFVRNEVFDLLLATQIGDLATTRKDIFTVATHQSAAYLLRSLVEKKILSAPVRDGSDRCVGFVELLDIIGFILSELGDDQDAITAQRLAEFSLDKATVEDVLKASNRSQFVPMLANNPATSIVEVFASGVHRVALFDDKTKGVSMLVSQSDVLRFLANNVTSAKLKTIFGHSLEHMGYKAKPVFTIASNATVYKAFLKMHGTNAGALAVVDPDSSVLVGNISASDLRGMAQNSFDDLMLTVADFLKKYSPESGDPITAAPSDTLLDVVTKLSSNRLHQVWIVDDDKKPVGIISLTDVMQLLITYRHVPIDKRVAPDTTLSTPGTLTVEVVKAENLVKGDLMASDPYVVIRFPGEKHEQHKHTTVVPKTVNPEFSQTFAYFVTDEHRGEKMTFEVWDKDRFTADDSLGAVQIEIDWILNAFGTKNGAVTNFRDSWKLEGVDHGELQLDFSYQAN